MQPGLSDLVKTARMPELILYMALSDVRARYKRSVLGPFWITLGTLVGVVGLGFVWSELFHMDRATFIPILTIGLILWQFISGCIGEAAATFIRQGPIIKNHNLPLSLHPAQLVLRHLINLGHTAPLFFLVALVLGFPLHLTSFYALPALVLVVVNLYWMALLVGMLGARFRDLEYLINMIMPLLMFFSPVLYRPSALPFSGTLIWFNPLAHLIEIVRYPLLGEVPPLFVIAANVGFLIVGGGITLWLFNRKRNRIALWV